MRTIHQKNRGFSHPVHSELLVPVLVRVTEIKLATSKIFSNLLLHDFMSHVRLHDGRCVEKSPWNMPGVDRIHDARGFTTGLPPLSTFSLSSSSQSWKASPNLCQKIFRGTFGKLRKIAQFQIVWDSQVRFHGLRKNKPTVAMCCCPSQKLSPSKTTDKSDNVLCCEVAKLHRNWKQLTLNLIVWSDI